MAGDNTPGIHSNIELTYIPKMEAELVKKLSQVWFITFVRHERFKDSEYTFAFGNPTRELRDLYHFERPVLIVFTPYENFDTRALDFVDKLIFEYQNRLDKLVFILVSKDRNIEERVASIAVQDQESRIIVPLSYEELEIEKVSETVHNKLRKFFFTRDLFSFNSPLKSDNYFFGRNKAVSKFYDKYRSGENAGLFGLRKIGKTSTLYALKRLLAVKGEPCVFIDCQETAFHQRRWNAALAYIVRETASQLEFKMTSELNLKHGYSERDASTHFEEDLKTLSEFHTSRIGDELQRRILIILDEIESITFDIAASEHWASGRDFLFFWQAVRAVFQKNPDLFSFIVAGVNPKCIETARVGQSDNPIFMMIRPEYLGFFDFTEIKEMVSSIGNHMGISFEEEVYTYLVDDYGGHPFLIRDACSHLSSKVNKSSRPAKVTKVLYQKEKPELNVRLNNYLKLILDVLKTYYPIEYELLTHLAAGDDATFKEFAVELSDSVSHLLGYGIVGQQDNEFFFKVNSVKEFIAKTARLEEKLAEKYPEKWKVISQKRNELEPYLRKVILAVLIPRYGETGAKNRIFKYLPKERALKLEKLTVVELMNSEYTEIYLNDLAVVIGQYWGYFEHLFGRDKQAFEFYLQQINRFRVDAHAKQISDEDYAVVLSAFTWFEKQKERVSYLL